MSLPSQMQALVLDEYNPDLEIAIRSLRVGSRPTPKPGATQVLVRIEAAPANPSDLLFLQKRYGVSKTLPTVPGFEGAGTVVAAGSLLGRWLVGRRVAVGGQSDQDGTWAEYFLADALGGCVPLRDDLSIEQGATLLVNPLTAAALLDEARRKGARAVVQNAAASQVGRMVIGLARQSATPVVNIVRREEQVTLLRDLGAKIVLNSSDPDFEKQLRDRCRRVEATVAFDAVAGAMTGRLFNAIPKDGTIIVYGSLAEENCREISPLDLVFRNKRIEGFVLPAWIQKRGILTVLRQTRRLQEMMATGEIETAIQAQANLDGAVDALLDYARNMTAGKILIRP